MRAEGEHMKKLFQSTSSIQRKTNSVSWAFLNSNYFNPLPLYRGRQKRDVFILWLKLYFNPLPLYRGRLDGGFYRRRAQIFQSTSSIQRKTAKRRLPRRLPWYFNPLPLYRGRRTVRSLLRSPYPFQSTSSIQRKTLPKARRTPHHKNFNPLPLY